MRSSCLAHPQSEPLIVLRAWQVEACEGNHCAAALLSFFEYWHNVKLDQQSQAIKANQIAEAHGEQGHQDVTLLQFHSEADLEAGLLGLYKRQTIRRAIAFLVAEGFISLHANPNPRFCFDRTRFILFNADYCQQVIDSLHEGKIPDREGKNTSPSRKNPSRSGKNPSPIPETSSEIPSEISSSSRKRDSARASTRCPPSYQPSDALSHWAALKYPQIPVEECLDAMRDWEFKTPRRDWDAALRNWIRTEAKRGTVPGQPLSPTSLLSAKGQRSAAAMQRVLDRSSSDGQTGSSRLFSRPDYPGRTVQRRIE